MAETPTVPGELLKLLAPADEDVKAIRSFLPVKWLGRTAVVLAIVLGLLWYIPPLHEALEKFSGFSLRPLWLWNTLLLGLPALVAIAQIAAEWAAERKRKQAQALAVKIEAVPEGYFRIGPYLDTPEDRAKFDRADRAHEKVLAWLKRADATPLYLTGDSGSGKSSVLNAYALPELREAGWTVVEARAWQDPENALTEAVGKLTAARKWKLGEAKTLRERLEILARRADEKLLLVLDQFEEFVLLAGSERQKTHMGVFGSSGQVHRHIKKLRWLFRYPRSEPCSMTWLVPHQIKLTSGRRSKQLHQYPAFGGWGSGGRDHSFPRLFKPVHCSVPIAWIRQDRSGPGDWGDCVGASALRWSSSRRPR